MPKDSEKQGGASGASGPTYRGKVWVTDDRPEKQRNKSGRVKLPADFHGDDPVAVLNKIRDLIEAKPERKATLERLTLEKETPDEFEW